MIAIPQEFSAFIDDGIASGRFRSAEEAVTQGLRLLKSRDEQRDLLRADLQLGIDQLNNSKAELLNAADIKQRGRDRLSAATDS